MVMASMMLLLMLKSMTVLLMMRMMVIIVLIMSAAKILIIIMTIIEFTVSVIMATMIRMVNFCNADNYNDGNMLIENHVQNISN
jgi:hypothetical protein